MKVSVLIPAAGQSVRFGSKKKKQFAEVDGRAVFLRSIEAFADRDDVLEVILAIAENDEELFNIKYGASIGFYGVKVVKGGAERHDTVAKMLEAVSGEADLIALHDAVRPCVTPKMIDDVFAEAAQSGAAILAAPLVGTVKKVNVDKKIVGND